jgi:hypothetical protein
MRKARSRLGEQCAVVGLGVVPGERVAVGNEGFVQIGPILLGQHAFGQRQDLALLERHVGEVEVDVALRCLLECQPARLAEHLEAEQCVFERPDHVFAARVVVVEPVEQLARQRRAGAQLREQQLGLLAMVPLLRELVDVEQHRAQRGEVRQGVLAAVLLDQQQYRAQHGRECSVLFSNDADGDVCHADSP